MNQHDRFTARAKTAIEKAQAAAEEMGHSYVGSEHLLLGIVREDGGQGARILRDNGLTDAAEFLGLTISPNEEYKEFVNTLLETINVANRKSRTRECMFNTEFVPGENLSGKNYKWDKKDGYFVSAKHNMYSSYFYNPEDESLTMIDKFKLHGEDFVKYLDGGSALHMNIAEHLSQEQYRQLLNTAAHYGTNYFTFNCRNTVCNDCGYISKDTLTVCPKCGGTNLDYLTRVIGYLKRVSSFSEMRQEEAHKRFYID